MYEVFSKTAAALVVIREALTPNLRDGHGAIIDDAIEANRAVAREMEGVEQGPDRDDGQGRVDAVPFDILTAEEVAAVRALLAQPVPPAFAAFDGDGDGRPGGSAPRDTVTVSVDGADTGPGRVIEAETAGGGLKAKTWPEGVRFSDENDTTSLCVEVSALGLPGSAKKVKEQVEKMFEDSSVARAAVDAAFPNMLDGVDVGMLHDDVAGTGGLITVKAPAAA